ncbi:MAG: calcineurin-like phosphoesterase C-terminal domain-containing protein [Mariniblastus sp.]
MTNKTSISAGSLPSRCWLAIVSVSLCAILIQNVQAQDSQSASPQPNDVVRDAAAQSQEPAESAIKNSKAKESNRAQKTKGSTALGRVFIDLDNDGKFSDNDSPFVKVKVSNGKDIVLTDEFGKYELPVENDSAIFVIKPMGYRTALTKDNLPKFFYLHKPDGSPQFKFAGVAPTGSLPQSIDFPLYAQNEPDAFKILLFGDPQPRNQKEVDYITHDVVSELIGDNSAFGVTLGDIAFDNLDTFKTLNQSIAMIGIPWYNVIGNHDLNLDAKTRKNINETFESTYGPSYYSFDYGQVHFVVLDNIDWSVDPKPHYMANFGKQQMAFLEKDLSMIPETQMVVLLMHIPIMKAGDKAEFFKLIEKRPYCVSVSGHTHDHRHLFLGKKDGFNGEKPHHHIVNVTVSGSWWTGAKNDNGIPHATMSDGAPNGYSIMNFDANGYRLDFKAAGHAASEQMRVEVPNTVDTNKTAETDVWVNVFNGSEKSTVQMAVDNSGDWITLEKKMAIDPHYKNLVERDANVVPKPARATKSYHLWTAKLPAGISPGAHLLRVQTTDMHGRNYFAHRSIRVTGTPVPKATDTEETTDAAPTTKNK